MDVDGDIYNYEAIPILPEAWEINRMAKPIYIAGKHC